MFIVLMSAFLMVAPAFADSGCRNNKFLGSYISPDLNFDIFGDGSVIKSYAVHLTLHADGTAQQSLTRALDYMMNIDTSTPFIGSWTCRNDGKLVVSMLAAVYVPSPISENAPLPDLTLRSHIKNTDLFEVVDDSTLKRVQRRQRRYSASQDPTNPTAGTLRPLDTREAVFTRFVASDADLLAP